MIPHKLPPTEAEVLKLSLTACRQQLESARADGDTLAADLAESDLNAMLDRLLQIGYAPGRANDGRRLAAQ